MRTSHAAAMTKPTPRWSEEPLDLARVNLDSPSERRYWVEYFKTTESKLHEAVSLMGAEVPRVRAYLRRIR